MKRKQYLAASLALLFTLSLNGNALADTPAPISHKKSFQAGVKAYEAGENQAYLKNLLQMQKDMPPLGHSVDDDGNRPFMLYHLARAQALNGQNDAAMATLNLILDEDIEGLMICQSQWDAAFKDLVDGKAYKKLERKMQLHPIQSEKLSANLHLLTGSGPALLASIGKDGVLLVDTGYAPASTAIQKKLKGLGGKDIRYIINTHKHLDHVGGNETLGKTATIIAHEATRAALEEPQEFIDQKLPAAAPSARPALTLSKSISLHFNGERIQIIPLIGHTEGDVMVYFESSQVLHMGDRYFPTPGKPLFNYPGPDLWAYLDAMQPVVDALSEDGTVISGHNPPVPASHLKLSHDALLSAVDYVEEQIEAGVSLEALLEMGPPSQWNKWTRGRSVGWLKYLYGQVQKQAT